MPDIYLSEAPIGILGCMTNLKAFLFRLGCFINYAAVVDTHYLAVNGTSTQASRLAFNPSSSFTHCLI